MQLNVSSLRIAELGEWINRWEPWEAVFRFSVVPLKREFGQLLVFRVRLGLHAGSFVLAAVSGQPFWLYIS